MVIPARSKVADMKSKRLKRIEKAKYFKVLFQVLGTAINLFRFFQIRTV